MEVKAPAVFFSYDDWWLKEWCDFLPILDQHGIKATFYPCFRSNMDSEYWGREEIKKNTNNDWPNMLKKIANKGHTIGYHTVNHANVYNLMKKGKMLTCSQYKEFEIFPGLEFLAEHGIKPRHFSYPYGMLFKNTFIDDEIDDCLLTIFDTVRIAVLPTAMETYDIESLREKKSFKSMDIKEHELIPLLQRIYEEKKAIFIYAHNPTNFYNKFKAMADFAHRVGISFYPMSVLDRP